MRQATVEDIPALEEMARRFHEKKQTRYPFKDARAFFEWAMCTGVVFIADDGFLVGAAVPEASNDEYKVAHELFWWSEGLSGQRMRRAFEAWAVDNGCQEIQFSHPAAEIMVGRLLDRAGYEPATVVWRKKCA